MNELPLREHIERDVAIAALKIAQDIALYGLGDGGGTRAGGFFFIVGTANTIIDSVDEDGYNRYGTRDESLEGGRNRRTANVKDYGNNESTRREINRWINEDGAFVIDGKTGDIHSYTFFVQTSRFAAENVGGSRSRLHHPLLLRLEGIW